MLLRYFVQSDARVHSIARQLRQTVKAKTGRAGKYGSPQTGSRLRVGTDSSPAIFFADGPIEAVSLHIIYWPRAMLQHFRAEPEDVVVMLLAHNAVVL